MDNLLTENHVTLQQSPQKQIVQVNRKKESGTRRNVPETQDTFLQRHEQGRHDSRQLTQTADIKESTIVSDGHEHYSISKL